MSRDLSSDTMLHRESET